MIVDKEYCMSSYLMLRTIYPPNRTFGKDIVPKFFKENPDRHFINDSLELELILKSKVEETCKNKRTAIALSGGIDSAILAKFMPKGSIAYTFRCVVPGVEVVDETKTAAKYAAECGLEHRVIEIYWEDFERYAPILMKNKGTPIHSIEVQIYKAAVIAKEEGVEALVFGETADVNYGGFDGLLSRDWSISGYIERFSHLLPYKVLVEPIIINRPFIEYSNDGIVDVHEFNRHVYYCESMGSYTNAMECAGMFFSAPFSKTYLGVPLDYERVRKGENKYLIREIFNRLYPGFKVPPKIPMPRPMNEWLKDWKGPSRKEFLPNCVNELSGDQKWLVWALEKFLNIFEKKN